MRTCASAEVESHSRPCSFRSNPRGSSTQRLHQTAVMQVRFRVIRVDRQCSLEAALRRDPIPFTEKHHLSQRDLCVCALVIQRKRAKRGSLGIGERFEVRHIVNRRLRNFRERQPRVCGGIGRIDFGCCSKRRYGVGELKEGSGAQMRPSPGDELGCFRDPRPVGIVTSSVTAPLVERAP